MLKVGTVVGMKTAGFEPLEAHGTHFEPVVGAKG